MNPKSAQRTSTLTGARNVKVKKTQPIATQIVANRMLKPTRFLVHALQLRSQKSASDHRMARVR